MSVFVYRLDITYPEGSTEWGWEPEGEWWKELSGGQGPGPDETFSWPQEHLYLSRSGASKRADLLRKWGATVRVEKSRPVEWDGDEA